MAKAPAKTTRLRPDDHIGDREAAWFEHAKRFLEHAVLVTRKVDHAVGDDDVHRSIRQRDVLDFNLFSALPDHVGGSRTDGGERPRDDVGREFVPRDVERRFSFNSVPIREGIILFSMSLVIVLSVSLTEYVPK